MNPYQTCTRHPGYVAVWQSIHTDCPACAEDAESLARRAGNVEDVVRAIEMKADDRLAEMREQRDEARRFIERTGYRRCDSPACNCGSWHRRADAIERGEP